MTTDTYAVRIRREIVLNGYRMSERNRRRLFRYLLRSMYGTRPGLPAGHDRYKAAAMAAFGEQP